MLSEKPNRLKLPIGQKRTPPCRSRGRFSPAPARWVPSHHVCVPRFHAAHTPVTESRLPLMMCWK